MTYFQDSDDGKSGDELVVDVQNDVSQIETIYVQGCHY